MSYDFFTYKIELGTATPVVYQQSQGPLYAELLTTNKLSDYHTDLNKQAETMFSRLVKQLSEKEGVTEVLKAENQMLWVQRMNNIRSAAMEIVSSELIYC